jgi:malate/lactate dehydrogenase
MSLFLKDQYSRRLAVISCDNGMLASIAALVARPDEMNLIDFSMDQLIRSSIYNSNSSTNIKAASFDSLFDCDALIINSPDAESIAKKAVENGFDGVFIVVGSSDECMAVLCGSGYISTRKNECMATDMVTKNASLRLAIGKYFSISPHDVSVFYIGADKNGFIAWSSGSVGSKSILDIIDDSRDVYSYEKLLETSSEAVNFPLSSLCHAFSAAHLARAVLYDERRILTPVSMLSGDYGHSGICLALPAVIGKRGIVEKQKIPLDSYELSQLNSICDSLSKIKKQAPLYGSDAH